MAKPDVRNEAIRLRKVDRMSYGEIAKKLNVSKGTLSIWLKPFRLTRQELRARRGFSQPFPTIVLPPFSTKQVGDVGVQVVILRILEQGFAVLSPLGDRLPYDIAVDVLGTIYKIQVKVAFKTVRKGRNNNCRDGYHYQVGCRTPTGKQKYTVNDFDFAAIFVRETGVVYVLPSAEFVTRSSIAIFGKGWIDKYKEAWHLLSNK